ncbi:hypothetical protein BYT27DRAFT_7088668, partial [Phlegmacium glaucopus]
GQRIQPQSIRPYLQLHGLFLECFCGITSAMPISTCIVHGFDSGIVYGFCHYLPSRCGFEGSFSSLLQNRKLILCHSQLHSTSHRGQLRILLLIPSNKKYEYHHPNLLTIDSY